MYKIELGQLQGVPDHTSSAPMSGSMSLVLATKVLLTSQYLLVHVSHGHKASLVYKAWVQKLVRTIKCW